VSLAPCQWTGHPLPDNATCGLLCPVFPSCLPDPSNELLRSLQTLRDQSAVKDQEALLDNLVALHTAILRGLQEK
jgi:hypothetical protein